MKINAKNDLNQKYILIAVLMLICIAQMTFGQTINQTQNKADQTLRSTGRVNPSTLGMELSIPLADYAGRAGNDKPLTLQYSSKVWSTWKPDTWETQLGTPVTDLRPWFAKWSVQGWTTSLHIPRIEFPDDLYDDNGRLWGGEPNVSTSYVKRVKVKMPDGSAYDLRQDDSLYPITPGTNFDWTGTYLSVDGSKTRLEANSSQSIFYLPDGGRIFFDSNRVVTSYIDQHGNKTIYNVSTNQWTDTLGRVLTNPLTLQSTEGTQVYQFPGFNGQNQQVEFVWAKLSTQHSSPAYMTKRFCLSFQDKNLPAGSTILFSVSGVPTNACDPFTTPFDPIVLTEVHLQDGSAYKFRYNLYAEIDKIEYPTGGYERFEYETITPLQSAADHGYDQFNRGVKKRWISSDGTTASEVLWQYDVTRVNQELPTDYYKIRTTAPDNSYTEQYLFDQDSDVESLYGFGNIAIGSPYEERVYSKTGQLLRRKLTKYTKTGALTGGYMEATRDLRAEKEISIIFEPGENYVLAQRSETVYETPGQNGAPSDEGYFAALNPKQTKTYHYVVLSSFDASPSSTLIGDTEFNRINSLLSNASVAKINEADYLYDANYKARNINGLVTESRVKDASGSVKAKSQISYDESGYWLSSTGSMPTAAVNSWVDPTQPNELGSIIGSKRGLTTTVKSYSDIATGQYIQTHSFYDQYGNICKTRDGRGNDTETEYSASFAFAYPTLIRIPIPDTSGVNGSNTAFITTTNYDYNTGLATSTTNANGQTTQMSYADPATGVLDPLFRIRKETAPNGHQTITEYGAGTSAATRFVKVKAQIDETKWKEDYTWFDGLGRTVKMQSVDSNGDIFVETEYDNIGRAKRATNPYRNGETIYWTENFYDDLSRITKVKTPDNTEVNTAYSLAATGSQIGTVVTVTDEAEKKIRSIMNVFDEVIRVDEPDNNGNLGTIDNPIQPTYYSYNTLGKIVKVQQGGQSRFFMYDPLNRLLRVRQPEQNVNPALNTTGNPDNNQWTAGFTYDNNKNILSSTDAKGVVITYNYDNLDRMLTRTYYDGTPPVSFKYDNVQYGKGKLIEISNSVSTGKTTLFDNLGRALTYQQITDGQTYTSNYQYNLAGGLVSETYPSGRQVNYDYNADGDLSGVWGQIGQNQKTYANSFSYTASGSVSSIKLGNGRWETTKFNSRLQVTEVGLGNSGTDTTLWKVTLDYGEIDANGNLNTAKNTGNIAKQTLAIPGMTNPLVQTYKYDSLDRLTEAKETSGGQQTWIQNFGYDRFGNRTSFNQQIGGTQTSQTPNIDPNTNRFSAGQGYLYDFNGNLLQDAEGRQFTFNGDNKQTQVKDANQNVIGTYFYDGEGKRIKKITNLENTIFVYSGGKLVAEYSTQIPSNPTTNYTTTDHLGSPRVITNALGEVISRRDFMPFGENLYSGVGGRTESQKYSQSGVDSVRNRFTSYQKDQETGLDFAEARYYNSSHGRFTAVDPLLASGKSDNPQSFNRYVYVLNSPTNLVDPSGLKSEGAECNFRCRVMNAINNNGKLSDDDLALAKFHVANGTALGYSFLNTIQQQVRPVQRQPRSARNNSSGNGRRGNSGGGRGGGNGGGGGRRPNRPFGPGLNEAEAQREAQRALENNLRDVILLPLLGPQRVYGRVDFNNLENHHIFPRSREFAEWWRLLGITIDNYTIRIPRGQHTGAGGLHTGLGMGRGGWWNNQWREFFEQNRRPTREQVFQKAQQMIQQAQVIGPIVHYRYRPSTPAMQAPQQE